MIFGHHLIFSIVTSSADVLTRDEANRLERGNGGRHDSAYYEPAYSSSLPNLPVVGFTRVTRPTGTSLATRVSAACNTPAR
jgi:hypothetical protein